MFAIGFAMLFMVTLGGLAARGMLPTVVPVFYAAASIAAAIAYRLDKSAAEGNVWRTSEMMLHVMALIGGWPGALVAQQVFRHKFTETVLPISVLDHRRAELRRAYLFGMDGASVSINAAATSDRPRPDAKATWRLLGIFCCEPNKQRQRHKESKADY